MLPKTITCKDCGVETDDYYFDYDENYFCQKCARKEELEEKQFRLREFEKWLADQVERKKDMVVGIRKLKKEISKISKISHNPKGLSLHPKRAHQIVKIKHQN